MTSGGAGFLHYLTLRKALFPHCYFGEWWGVFLNNVLQTCHNSAHAQHAPHRLSFHFSPLCKHLSAFVPVPAYIKRVSQSIL